MSISNPGPDDAPARRPGQRPRLLVIAVAAVITTACAVAPAGSGGPSEMLSARATPVLGVPGSDGMHHLEYDLIVASTVPAEVTLTSVEVLDLSRRPLLRLDGDALVAATQPLDGLTRTTTIPAAGSVAVVVDLPIAPDLIPERLAHRITYGAAPNTHSVDDLEVAVDPRPPLVVTPPLSGPGWLSANSCCDSFSTHRSGRVVPVESGPTAKPETFAVDWIQLHGDQPFTGDGARPEQWFGHGADVRAVLPGSVVAVRDGLPDSPLGAPPTGISAADTAGNHVVVQVGPDTWAFYAHLQPGSPTVTAGDRVTAGQVLGKVGNSGNSLAPHLHFGLLDAPHPDKANSLPFVLDRYTVVDSVDRDSYLAAFNGTGPLKLRPHGHPSAQSGTFPLSLAVIDFP